MAWQFPVKRSWWTSVDLFLYFWCGWWPLMQWFFCKTLCSCGLFTSNFPPKPHVAVPICGLEDLPGWDTEKWRYSQDQHESNTLCLFPGFLLKLSHLTMFCIRLQMPHSSDLDTPRQRSKSWELRKSGGMLFTSWFSHTGGHYHTCCYCSKHSLSLFSGFKGF